MRERYREFDFEQMHVPEIRDTDKSRRPHLKLQEFSGEEDW
jgi:hypothetical protein